MDEEKLFKQFAGFLKTPPLWKEDNFLGVKQFELPEVPIPTDIDITAIVSSITNNFVLGKRMECFLELLIKLSVDFRFIASNLQIIQDKVTVGEIDFLIEDLFQKKVLHIEMVYKFYIYDPSISNELERWIGPNRKDSLLRKMNKLKNYQLPLIFKPESKNILSTYNISAENLEQAVCFKANLFIPRGYKAEQIQLVNMDCILGFYMHRKEFTSREFSNHMFCTPKKQDWPIEPHYNGTWCSYQEILIQITGLLEQKRSPLIWMRKEEQIFERFFIVWW